MGVAEFIGNKLEKAGIYEWKVNENHEQRTGSKQRRRCSLRNKRLE